jgi:hypothetical protein
VPAHISNSGTFGCEGKENKPGSIQYLIGVFTAKDFSQFEQRPILFFLRFVLYSTTLTVRAAIPSAQEEIENNLGFIIGNSSQMY